LNVARGRITANDGQFIRALFQFEKYGGRFTVARGQLTVARYRMNFARARLFFAS
jgi:hypothetical protein